MSENDRCSCHECSCAVEPEAASKPEPPPISTPQSEDVSEALIAWLRSHDHEDVIPLIHARRNYGVEKYGTTLQTHNGRDCVEDALQEAGDLLQYIMQAMMEDRGDIWARMPPLLNAISAIRNITLMWEA